MYEFVTKKEYSPIREEIEEIIKEVQRNLGKEDFDCTFQFKLVGSGKRHLITRIAGGNKGYDFDYNLILNDNWKPGIRECFFSAFQEAIKGTRFNKIEDSTSVITIKQVDKDDSKVIVGCDFSIVYFPDDADRYYYSRLNKNNENYTWEVRECTRDYDEKLGYLMKNCDDVWNYIKEEYLRLKNNDRQGKHSFVLYHEAVNNLYNQVRQEGWEEDHRIQDDDDDLL